MSRESDLDPVFIVVKCPACRTMLRVRDHLAGRVASCPACRAPLTIPVPELYTDETIESESKSSAETNPLDENSHGDGYRLASPLLHEPDKDVPAPLPAELRAPAPEHGFLDQLGQIRQAGGSQAPQYLFFSKVFDFPWQENVWPRWIWLVLGGTIISVLPVLGLGVLSQSSGYSGIALAFFALPQIWLTIWTGSYAASCGLQVFEDTAAGNDGITGWPEPNWREWMWAFMPQVYVALMVLAVAYGLGRAAGLSGVSMFWVIVVAEVILFPFCFLSVMEANQLVLLITPKMVRTLMSQPVLWLKFYSLVAVLAGIWTGGLYLICRTSLIAGMVLNGLLFGTFVLIYFRLLGRLGWSISHQRRRRKTAA